MDVPDKGDEWTCAWCGEVFECAWTDQEAKDEYAKNFPLHPPPEEGDIVCDDCYKKLGFLN